MQISNEPKVEFFQSQSEYSSALQLTSSRFIYFVQEILEQANKIQNSLREQLTRQYTENLKQKLKIIMNRASILTYFTIPEQLQHMRRAGNKSRDQNKNQDLLKKCLQQAKSIQQNYNKLLNRQITYDQFYRIYAKISQRNFKKQEENQAIFINNNSRFFTQSRSKLQQIQVVQPAQVKFMLSNSSTSFYKSNNLNSQYKSQNKWLTQQISELKQKNLSIKTTFQAKFEKLKLNYEKRLQKMINLKGQQSKNVLLEELQQSKKSLTIEIQQKLLQIQKRNQIQVQLNSLKKQHECLRKQLEDLKQISNSRLTLQQSKSVLTSSYNKNQKQKKIRNDQSLINLLKYQVKNQRLKIQSIKTQCKNKLEFELKKERMFIQQLNKKVQKLQLENDILRQKNEYLRVQKQKLQQKLLQFNKQISYLKQNLTQSRKNQLIKKEDNDKSKSYEIKQYTKNRQIHIQEYQGDGLEGFIHFQCLEKQFRYRFKRACLKEKELLYKKDGIQIGVITKTLSQILSSCKIIFTIYVTNYSDHLIKDINAKIMNYFKIIGNQKVQFLRAGQQKKFLVQLAIQSYPIGPVLLNIMSESNQQIRILLPANIFKLFKFQQTKQKHALKPIQIRLQVQKRIIKNYSCLKQLLNVKSNSSILNLIGTHEHTKSSLILNSQLQNQVMILKYQHLYGNSKIVEYFIKCFCFLVKKGS